MWKTSLQWWVLDDHLCFNEIGRVPFFINTAGVEPGSTHFEASAGYDHQIDVFANELVLKTLDVTLDNLSHPPAGDVLKEKIFQYIVVPNITSVQRCVDVLLPVLQRWSQI